MASDEDYMRRCIELAKKGTGWVSPNPMVGAVLVYQNRIIGEGWHKAFGQAHAEVNCFESVLLEDKILIPKSRLYVSLEPCSHFGKTPPCSNRIISEGIKDVFIGCKDSFAAVSGNGIRQLRENGVKVTTGVLETACRNLNKRFFKRQEENRPYVILKWAQSADGYMASDDQNKRIQISEWAQTRLVHKMRFEEDAVLVGYQTALLDNPKLNNRFWKQGKQPLRVLIDFDNSLPDSCHLKDNSQSTIIFNYQKEGQDQKTVWRKLKNNNKSTPQQILSELENVNSIIIEGGAKTLKAFIDSEKWDEAYVWRNSAKILGSGLKAPLLANANMVIEKKFGGDCLFKYNRVS